MAEPAPTRHRVPLELSVRGMLAGAGHRVVSTPVTVRRCDLYDTADRRLAAAGAELSFNSRAGWVWRRDARGHPKLATREWTAPPTTPAEQMHDWSRAYRRGRPLGVRAQVRVRRRRHQLINDDATEGMTLLEERIEARSPAGWTARLHTVDVAGPAEGDTAVATLELIRGAALPGDATLALLRPALVRAPRLRLPDPEGAGTRELFVRSTTLSLIQWLHFDCELSSGGSPDALRKLRVGLRRLRSDLQTFAPILDREWAAGLRDRLGDLGSGLGSVRDAEVLAARLAGTVEALPEQDRDAAQPLLETATAQLALARAQLLARLAGDRYVELLDAIVVALTDPRWSGAEAIPPVSRLARRPWHRLREAVRSIDGVPGDDRLHRIRILAKRARYAADACVPAAGEPAAACAGRLADLQTVLGEHHDATVTQAWLHTQAGAAADVAFVAGELTAIELARRRRAEAGWVEAWKAASRKQDWAWLRS